MRRKIRDGLLNHLPYVFLVCVSITYVGSFLLSGTHFEGQVRVIIYGLYALAVTAIFAGNVVLCRRSEDGKVSLWLATLTWATFFFACTLWGVFILSITFALFPQLQGVWWARQGAYALVGGGMTGDVIAAIVMWWGLSNRPRLNRHIYPWIRHRNGR